MQILLTHWRAEELAVKPCAFVLVRHIHLVRYYAAKKKKEKKKRKKKVPGGEGRRNNQNATRIRWDPTPERERSGRSWVRGKREGERRRGGKI